jgi:hypothetical protein
MMPIHPWFRFRGNNMPVKLPVVFIVILTAVSFILPLHAQSTSAPAQAAKPAPQAAPAETLREKVAALEEQSRLAFEAGKWVPWYSANMKLNQLVPYETRYLVNVVRACGLIDRKNTAYNYMYALQQQGFTYDFDSTDDTLKIRDTEAYHYINKLLVDAGKPGGEGIVAFKLPGSPADYSAFAWDSSRGRFLAGTVREGVLKAISGEGETTVLLKATAKNGLQSITGLAVDADNNRLWLSSSASPLFSGYPVAHRGQGALFELDLNTLEVLGRYDIPEDGLKHEPGNLVVSGDDHVYLIDRVFPIIYQKTPEGKKLEPFFASTDLLGLTDIAISPDNSRIFISDVAQGIMVVDPITYRAARLSGPETLNLGGIASVDYKEGQLFIVQAGFEPQRIIRLTLDGTGEAVESMAPMAVALAEFNHPGLGTIWGGSLFYLANAGAGEDSEAIVMSTNLDTKFEIEGPSIEELQEAIKGKVQ